MEIIQKQIRLEEIEYYKTHLYIVNALLPVKLAPKEISVLALFMSFKGDLAKDRFGSTAKKIVRTKLNLSQPGLGNYLKSLKRKGFLIKNRETRELEIIPILKPEDSVQMYQFKLINIL